MSQLGQNTNMWIFSARIDLLNADYSITLSTLTWRSLNGTCKKIYSVYQILVTMVTLVHPRKIAP